MKPLRQIWREWPRSWRLRSCKRAGQRLVELLDPDGRLSDERDRRRTRELFVGFQNRQAMSELSGRLTPGVRAKLDVLLANWAAPGMNQPR